MPLHLSGSTAISDADGTSSIIVDVSKVDSTNSQVDEGDATASFRNNDVHATSSYSNDQQGYCYCSKEEDYDMICCDSRDCVIKWFHFSCLQIIGKDGQKENIIVQTATS